MSPTSRPSRTAEWLETDGLGGFAMGTVDGIRTRRYHAALIHATTPPTGRMALVNGFEAWVEMNGRRIPISSQCYVPDVVHPDGASRRVSFSHEPWPTWTFDLGDGMRLEHELFVRHGFPVTAMAWRLSKRSSGARLSVRPLLSGRVTHALQRANPAFGFVPEARGALRIWHPYRGVPAVLTLAEAEYRHDPQWYYDFLYVEERARGLDFIEDLASPGMLVWDLSQTEATWLVAADTPDTRELLSGAEPTALHARLRDAERARRISFRSRLERSADDYIVARGSGRTIVAGYPWFTDWGRDTFIALRGLCLAGDRLEDARRILVEWSGAVSEGMLPNHFPERQEAPEFNSVDTSLWYVVAVHEWLEASKAAGARVPGADVAATLGAVGEILEGYARGTRHGIRMEADGLLAAGELGVQLTWMDAKIGDWVVTPRIGKPVEVQALWINALSIGSQHDTRWSSACQVARRAFERRFWNPERGALYDVVDVDHGGGDDATVRPNQIFALGGLPIVLLDAEKARSVVDVVERELWTPLGLRSLSPREPGYVSQYRGDVRQRDSAYHQGTAWPWLAGAFVEAWCRVRGDTKDARREARERFIAPLRAQLDEAGLGHVSEIADGDAPHAPNGCPFQAWSLGELMRLEAMLDPHRDEDGEKRGGYALQEQGPT